MAEFFPAATIFNVISLFSSGIGLIGFIQSNVPKEESFGDSSVRVAVALNGHEGVPFALYHAAGPAPIVRVFNENRDHIGESGDYLMEINSGSYRDIKIDQHRGPGQQAPWLQITSTPNELCIAYISQTWADGTSRGWVGDMGKGCDRDWYHSNIIVGKDHRPTCTWVDSDHNHGIATGGLQIYMQNFTNLTANYSKKIDDYCQYPTMLFEAEVGITYPVPKDHSIFATSLTRFWDNSNPSAKDGDIELDGLDDFLGGPDDPRPPRRRRTRRRAPLTRRSGSAVFSHLIASEHDGHSARELCESDFSHGPDFFSRSEGVFCDMDSKTTWPLCKEGSSPSSSSSSSKESGCYHWDTHSLVLPGEEAAVAVARNYSHVEEWK